MTSLRRHTAKCLTSWLELKYLGKQYRIASKRLLTIGTSITCNSVNTQIDDLITTVVERIDPGVRRKGNAITATWLGILRTNALNAHKTRENELREKSSGVHNEMARKYALIVGEVIIPDKNVLKHLTIKLVPLLRTFRTR